MENVAKNVVKNEVKAVNLAVNNIENKKEENTMENTNTNAVLTFEVTRNSHDALDVKFSEKPCREILMRMNEGFTKRSERFNWFNGVWSTFRFNTSKEAERDGKDNELLECKMFIEKIISEPLTMTDEEAQAKYKEVRAENKTTKKTASKKSEKSEKKETKKASAKKTETKKAETKEDKKEALNKKVNEYLKSVGVKRADFDKMPKQAKALILAGMPE